MIPLAAGAPDAVMAAPSGRAGGGRGASPRGSKPASVFGLLATVVLLFGFQGSVILAQPFLIVLLATPILNPVLRDLRAGLCVGLGLARAPSRRRPPCALIGTSNFFELAVAVAIGLFGLDSGAALVTVVGVLVEVPVMLSLVAFANRTRSRFPA